MDDLVRNVWNPSYEALSPAKKNENRRDVVRSYTRGVQITDKGRIAHTVLPNRQDNTRAAGSAVHLLLDCPGIIVQIQTGRRFNAVLRQRFEQADKRGRVPLIQLIALLPRLLASSCKGPKVSPISREAQPPSGRLFRLWISTVGCDLLPINRSFG